MGVTDLKIILLLARPFHVKVKVSYNISYERLHTKYLFLPENFSLINLSIKQKTDDVPVLSQTEDFTIDRKYTKEKYLILSPLSRFLLRIKTE